MPWQEGLPGRGAAYEALPGPFAGTAPSANGWRRVAAATATKLEAFQGECRRLEEEKLQLTEKMVELHTE